MCVCVCVCVYVCVCVCVRACVHNLSGSYMIKIGVWLRTSYVGAIVYSELARDHRVINKIELSNDSGHC